MLCVLAWIENKTTWFQKTVWFFYPSFAQKQIQTDRECYGLNLFLQHSAERALEYYLDFEIMYWTEQI